MTGEEASRENKGDLGSRNFSSHGRLSPLSILDLESRGGSCHPETPALLLTQVQFPTVVREEFKEIFLISENFTIADRKRTRRQIGILFQSPTRHRWLTATTQKLMMALIGKMLS